MPTVQQLLDTFRDRGLPIFHTLEGHQSDLSVILPDGKTYEQTAIELETTDWLVDGVRGSV